MSSASNAEVRELERASGRAASAIRSVTLPGRQRVDDPQPYLYLAVFGSWIASLIWFHPRLASLMDLAYSPGTWVALAFFVVFTEIAWLYAAFNVGVIVFATIYRRGRKAIATSLLPHTPPAVAILYTTCNDFVETSVLSCLHQDYPDFTVYILDDSSDPAFRRRIDRFAERYRERVRVVRRDTRRGYKAGNLNHGLARVATVEPFFALVDADEVLPRSFLAELVPQLVADTRCGFLQANHRANPISSSALAKAMGPGIDSHWRWYHPLRNRFGFVMLLGHGALIRRQAWVDAGGFPELVSEDLAFALRAREHGWRGRFVENVVCYEDFPNDVRAFRVRHMKWTRGTCEFLLKEMPRMLRSRHIPLVEKLDVLVPTLNLPLSLVFFLFVVDANVVLPMLFSSQMPVTIALAGHDFTLPTLRLAPQFAVLNSFDFYAITVVTLLSPVLCFIIDMVREPGKLIRFLCQSTALYGALGPLSSLGVALFVVTGKAVFYVTADRSSTSHKTILASGFAPLEGSWTRVRQFLRTSHPDHWPVQAFEFACGIAFVAMSVKLFQVSFLGLALAFTFMPILHHVRWENRLVQALVRVPFVLVLLGLALSGLSLAGMQTVLFGFGFHF